MVLGIRDTARESDTALEAGRLFPSAKLYPKKIKINKKIPQTHRGEKTVLISLSKHILLLQKLKGSTFNSRPA